MGETMLRVLQVDDERLLLELSKAFLEDSGEFQLHGVTSGREALSLLDDQQFDAVVSDYQMPGMDGIELLKRVRERDAGIPFILFTGRGREEVAMEALNLGANFYLQKGGDPESQFAELASKLRHAIERRRLQLSLQDSEARLAQAQRLAHVGSWTYRFSTDELILSDEMYRLIGQIPSAFRPSTGALVQMLHPEDRSRAVDTVKAALEQERPVSLQTRFILPNGEIRHSLVNVEMHRDGQGRLTDIHGAVTDVTEVVRAEEALRDSEMRWKYALEGAEEGVWDWDIRRDVLFRSDRYMGILGYRDYEPYADRRTWEESVHPEDLPRAVQALEAHLRGETPIYEVEYRERQADGSYVWILSHGKIMVRDPEGRPLRMVGTHTDITERRKAEEDLKESWALYEGLVNSLSDGLAIYQGGKVLFVNPAGMRMLGYSSADEAMDKDILDFVHPRSLLEVKERMRGSLELPNPWMEETFLHRDGTPLSVEVSTLPTVYKGRRAVQVMFRDLTGRKEAERQLRESEELYRTLFEGSGDGIFLMGEVIIEANTAAARMFGMTREALVGMAPYLLSPDVQPDGTSSQEAGLARVKEALNGQPTTFNWVHRRGDGSVFNAEVVLMAITLRGEHLLLATLRDISQRVAAENRIQEQNEEIQAQNEELTQINNQLMEASSRLLESEEKYRQLVENVQEGIAYIGEDRSIRFANRPLARLFDMEVEEIIGTRGLDYVAPSDRERAEQATEEVYRTGSFQAEFEMVSATGRPFQASISASAIRDLHDRFKGMVVLIADVTERRAMEMALKEANARLKILSSVTRHDILNQVMVLEGTLGIMQMGEEDPRRMKHLDRLSRACGAISRIINFTRDYDSMGAAAPSWQSLQEAWAAGTAQVDKPGVEVRSRLEGVEVLADPMLEKVFLNLADNAVRHGGMVRTIEASYHLNGNDLVVVVQDDGIGVPLDEKERIFEMGYGRNTGLGLFLARPILGITGLSIKESGSPGEGARFEITVPPGRFRLEQ